MITEDNIKIVAERMGLAADAERVVLFGSHARGEAQESSDVDLLVIAESELPRFKRSRELYKLIKPYPFAMRTFHRLAQHPRVVRGQCVTFFHFNGTPWGCEGSVEVKELSCCHRTGYGVAIATGYRDGYSGLYPGGNQKMGTNICLICLNCFKGRQNSL